MRWLVSSCRAWLPTKLKFCRSQLPQRGGAGGGGGRGGALKNPPVRPLLDFHLRTLAGRAVRTVFLEVDERNAPARRLYARAGFAEVGSRHGYYETGATALVLRRDLG